MTMHGLTSQIESCSFWLDSTLPVYRIHLIALILLPVIFLFASLKAKLRGIRFENFEAVLKESEAILKDLTKIGLQHVFKDCGYALRLLEVRIPMHTIRNQSARLECHFDLEGEALYSVKWYKDGNEFYRFVPRDIPPVQLFPLPGVTVDTDNSNATQVTLQSVDLLASGKYRCEVSGEAPSFQTVSDHGDMLVVALPTEGPRISGGRPRYQIGDMVRINCTAGKSKPAAQLMWFINGEQADPKLIRGPYVIEDPRDELETAILGLEFEVRHQHFKKGDMKLKCLATIATVYWRSNEESVEGEKPQKAPVLESRETVPPSESRADRVQASGPCLSPAPSIFLLVTCFLLDLVSSRLTSISLDMTTR
ncbi:uncharacterized protein [Anabrus simplex]|uniref:uncharacterized protein n=1 Tax=Anabrus simplex TaxID=316456 RepID=UPI0035A2A445